MKTQVRNGLFETNSSSMHNITLCSGNDFDKWKNGELVYDYEKGKLVPIDDLGYQVWKEHYDKQVKLYGSYEDGWDYMTYDQFFNDWDTLPYETFASNYTTEHGDKVTAFGFYGYD